MPKSRVGPRLSSSPRPPQRPGLRLLLALLACLALTAYEVRIALGREREPDAVATPWARELECPERPAEPVPAARSTLEVFDASPGQLLIQGDPGAGKTVELLHLARDLIARAGPDDPVPVLINLSSFDDPALALNEWLDRGQVEQYLNQAGPTLAGLRQALAENRTSPRWPTPR